jgi:hypothetical protein
MPPMWRRQRRIASNALIVRFHHQISLKTMLNGILHAKSGKAIYLYDLTNGNTNTSFDANL